MLDIKLKIEDILEADNVAELLTEEELSSIGNHVCEGYEADLETRVEWEDKIDEWLNLALQVAEEKTYPWPNAANVKYPLLTTAALQFSARAYPSLLPGTSVVRGRVIGFDPAGDKLSKAIRVGKHMSYQVLEEMEDWEEQMDKLLFALPILGCMFKKTYYSSLLGHNVSEIVYPKELVVNYWAKSLEDAERITHVLKMSENDVYERKAEGTYLDVDLTRVIDDSVETISEVASGISPQSIEDETVPYDILEQHCYFDLDGDGYREPYIISADLGSKNVLRIVPRFDEDSIQYNMDDNIVRIIADHYFTKYSFVPSPDGSFYDIGFGILLGPINDTINTVVNQLLDAGTMSNMQVGFLARGLRIKGGDKGFRPNEWKYVNATGDDLRKSIFPLPTREPSSVLFNLLNLMINAGEKLSSVTDMMTGDIPGQNTKATVAMAAIEQGMKVFSSIYKRVHRSLAKEYKKLFKLNSKHLPLETYFTVLDVGQEEAQKVGQSDYLAGDVDIVPASDPNIATEQQRLAKVQAIFEVLPLGNINPMEATKRYLEATEQPNIEALMKMPPPQPNPEFELKKAELQQDGEIAWAKIENERERIDVDAILKLAQAEGVEIGQQLDLYKAQLEELKLKLSAEEKRRGANERRVSGMEKSQSN